MIHESDSHHNISVATTNTAKTRMMRIWNQYRSMSRTTRDSLADSGSENSALIANPYICQRRRTASAMVASTARSATTTPKPGPLDEVVVSVPPTIWPLLSVEFAV